MSAKTRETQACSSCAAPTRNPESDAIPPLTDELQALYRSVEVDVKQLTASSVTLVIDLVFEDLGIAPELPFKEKLARFKSLPNVRPEFVRALERMGVLGGDAGQAAWGPAVEDMDGLMAELERFVKIQYGPKPAPEQRRGANRRKWGRVKAVFRKRGVT